jgi:hypothetical protein
MSEQLEFFEPTHIEKLQKKIDDLEKMLTRVVRNQYGKIGKLEYNDKNIEQKLNFLEHKICNPDKPFDLVSQ